MIKKILRGLFTFIGIGIGYLIGSALINNSDITFLNYFREDTVLKIVFVVVSMILFGLIMLLISPWINSGIFKVMDRLEKSIQALSANEMIFGVAGAIVGLIISSFFVNIVARINIVGTGVALLISIFMAFFGADIAIKKKEELLNMFSNLKRMNGRDKKNKNISRGDPKVLDTSVIIDGRIFDICQTGFIEGALVIPNFVLEELRHIADSSDALKRNRGRRGLDILNKIQNELNIEVQITEKDFPEIAEVDSKLLKLAQVLNGKVITNDYNLNKVAKFQGVPVLNINELANAVKPVVLPGEEMTIQIIKDGKESGQGIAYLDDGTMIVVEGARRRIGEIMDVVVTSVLQTAAGRMIFARQKDQMEQAE
ncbi:MAG: PIN/TRAM domain-containing protein [Clostridiaceae bacterium]|nr:PIN/TRAM domain-containing protein [Clostridiaceae bacterium]